MRTGRASPALLDRIVVDYYGAPTPLQQLATLDAPEARLLTVQPYDKASIKAIEKAIMESDIGLTPNNDGNLIRLPIPSSTRSAAASSSRSSARIAEEGRIAIRNVRRDVMHDLRELKEAGETGADDERRAEEELQKLTDARIAELDALAEGQGRRDPRGLRTSGAATSCPSARATSRSSPTATAAGPSQRGLRRSRRPRGRRRRRQGAAARRRRARHRGADGLLVLDRELVAPGRGGRRR